LNHTDLTRHFKYVKKTSEYYEITLNIFKMIQTRHRVEALTYLLELLDAGIHYNEICQEIFRPLLYDIGHLWESGMISVAQEHHFSANIQFLISNIYIHITPALPHNGRMLAACVSDEPHDIGLRMISDLFDFEGWDVLFLGGNMSKFHFLKEVRDFKPHICCLSYTMDWNFLEVVDWIQTARAAVNYKIEFIVGGYNIDNRADRFIEMDVKVYQGEIEPILLAAKQFLQSSDRA